VLLCKKDVFPKVSKIFLYVISPASASCYKMCFMPQNLQINIPDPCQESWETMHPQDNGRHCEGCSKIVVDFTGMSDREILAWLTDANRKVCGRFSPDQLNRNLLPVPEKKRKAWMIWNFLLAGLLVSSKAPAQAKSPAPPVNQNDKKLLGKLSMALAPVEADTPKYSVLPPVVIQGYPTRSCRTVMGGLTMVRVIDGTPILKKLLKDTLAMIGIPKKELTLYPNPASRGTAIKLSLPSDQPGEYKLELFNGSGALLQGKRVEWTDRSQIQLLAIPASLAAGAYFVKLSHAGTGKVYTRKLMVL
jgi:hypothetical protein